MDSDSILGDIVLNRWATFSLPTNGTTEPLQRLDSENVRPERQFNSVKFLRPIFWAFFGQYLDPFEAGSIRHQTVG